MNLQAGDLGIDYSGYRLDTAAKWNAFDKAHGTFVIRYSAGAASLENHPSYSSVKWKLCEPGEIDAAVAHGKDFIANDEWYESRVTEGKKAGKADGKAAAKFWKSRGLARGASIYCSWDAHPDSSKWSKVIAYLRAFNKALKGYYHVDCYAGTPFLEHAKKLGVIRFGWRPNAGSWSNDGLPYAPDDAVEHLPAAADATPAHIWQTGAYWFGKNADENLILRTPVGSHLEALDGGIVALSSKDVDRIARRVLTMDGVLPSPPDAAKSNKFWSLNSYIRSIRAYAVAGRKDAAGNGKLLAEALKRIAELQADVAALKDAGGKVKLEPTDVPVTGTVHIGEAK